MVGHTNDQQLRCQCHLMTFGIQLIAHPNLLVRVTNVRVLSARATFRVGLASESHRLQPMLMLTLHWLSRTSMCGWAISALTDILA